VDTVEDLLQESQADPNHKFSDGSPSLCVAVLRGFYRLVVLLAKSGASVQATVTGGFSPLHLAARADSKDIAEFLYMYSTRP
jgi:ankyrin repeat protein